MHSERRLAPHLPRPSTTIFYGERSPHTVVFVDGQRPPATPPSSMSDLDTHFLRPGALARTPFGTPFFVLFTHPELDITGLCKRRLNRRMRAEMEAWEKLQRTRKPTENKSYRDLLREDRVPVAEEAQVVNAPVVERTAGAEIAVEGAGNPNHSVPDANGPGDERGVGEATVPATENGVCDTNSTSQSSGVVHEIAGFVVIDMAEPTGSALWDNNSAGRRKVRSLGNVQQYLSYSP